MAVRWVLAGTVVLCLAMLVPVGTRGAGEETVFRLPGDARPGHVALGDDGSVWMADDYDGVTRLGQDGLAKHYLSVDDFAHDVVRGPDGAIWVAGATKLIRIDAAGRTTALPVGFEEGIAATSNDVWMAEGRSDVSRPGLERIDASRRVRVFPDPVPSSWLGFTSLAGAPDGSLWFTQSRQQLAGGIGRMTPDGRFTNWWLRSGEPEHIVAGPNGAAWFTEGHSLGRITGGGAISWFPLPAHLSATDLAARDDGSVWFVSDSCVGSMTVDGRLTTWPVQGAWQLDGLVAAPDGTLWLADRIGNAIRHFDSTVVAPAPCGAPTATRHAGGTVATLAYKRDERFGGIDYFSDVQIRIARRGRVLVNQPVAGLAGHAAYGDTASLVVRDLDGDGEPEVAVLLNWNGAHCCWWSRVYHYDRPRHRYVTVRHFWGEATSLPHLRADGGLPVFVSRDGRFNYAVANDSFSAGPIQVWSYLHGTFRDVTRRHMQLIRRDAASLWRQYIRHRRDDPRGILAAWVGDEYLLGRVDAADRILDAAPVRHRHAYLRAVKALLDRKASR